MLKKDGLLLDAPGRGLLVAPLDADVDQPRLRGARRARCAGRAAWPRRRRAVIDPRLIERGRRAARGRSIKAMIDADIAFHNAIYAASGNPLIEHSASLHWVHLKRVMGAVLQSSPQRESIWDEHEAIAAAIAAGDVERAVALIDHHGRQASEILLGRLSDVYSPCEGICHETHRRPASSSSTATAICSSPACSAPRRPAR